MARTYRAAYDSERRAAHIGMCRWWLAWNRAIDVGVADGILTMDKTQQSRSSG